MNATPYHPAGSRGRLLVAEDDEALRLRLARAMAARGYAVVSAESVAAARAAIAAAVPDYAVTDLRLGDGSGLDVVDAVRAANPDARVIVLSGYADIEIAVAAVKLGAVDCLAKPATADEIEAALNAPQGRMPEPPRAPISPDDARWEHIQRVYDLCGGNVSETARQLNMHRRTLQRVLARR